MIILTGGAGFIGSAFLWKLNQEGITDLLVVDHLSDNPQKKLNLEDKKYSRYLEKDEFLKLVKADKISGPIEAVFHVGACSSTLQTDENYLRKNNYEYSKTLAGWCLDRDIPFFYASSGATYGDGSFGYSDDDENTLKLKPLNPYGRSKQDFDLWVIKNKLQDKMVGWKYFNVFGPNEYHKGEMRSLVVKAFNQINRDGRVRLFKSYKPEYKHGGQKRDFVYIKDIVDLMFEFFKAPKIKGIFNLGTGRARSWNDMVSAIFAALNLPVNIEYIDMPEYLKARYQYFTQADLTKLRHAGIKHMFAPLEEAVKDYVTGYLRQKKYL